MKNGNGSAHRQERFCKEPSSRTSFDTAIANRFLAALLVLSVLVVVGMPSIVSAQQGAIESDTNAAPSPVRRSAASRSHYDDHLSTGLNDFLHGHHLPFVDAMVFSNASDEPTLVKLSGQVRTEHGKEDAASKSSDFLNQPGIKIQNRVEVVSGLASTVPASTSASAEPPPDSASARGGLALGPNTAAPNDPCTDLCFKDEGHCNTACQSQAAGGATGGGISVQGILGQFGQSATQLKQCNDQCVQTREHCTYDCQQNGSSGSAREAADSGAPPARELDHHAEGPNTPPE
jgi:hypothetical protein